MRRQLYKNFTMILIAVLSRDSPLLHETINQFNRAVVTKAKAMRKRGNGRARSFRQAFNGEKHLVLLRFDVTGASSVLAEVQELADAVAELRQLAITRL